jgi:hypothetical protein
MRSLNLLNARAVTELTSTHAILAGSELDLGRSRGQCHPHAGGV